MPVVFNKPLDYEFQPSDSLQVKREWLLPGMSVFLPPNLRDLINNTSYMTESLTYGDQYVTPYGHVYGYKGANYGNAFIFNGGLGAPEAWLTVCSTNPTTNGAYLGTTSTGLAFYTSKWSCYVSGSRRLSLTGTPAAGDIVYIQFQNNNYKLYTEYEEASIGGAFGDGSCTAFGDFPTHSSALLIRWSGGHFPTDAQIRLLLKDPWQIFEPIPQIYMLPAGAAGATIDLTGLSSTASIGTLTPTGGASFSLTGLSSTANIGNLTITLGEIINLTGQSITSSQGFISVAGGAVVNLSGQQITLSQGTLTLIAGTLIALTGQYITPGQGSLNITGGSQIDLTGLDITTGLGSLNVLAGGVQIHLTGLPITTNQGTLIPIGGANFGLTGLNITGDLGSLTAASHVAVTLTGLQATAQQGVFIVTTGAAITLTGLSATGSLGSISIGTLGSGVNVETPTHRIYTIQKDNRTLLILQDKRVDPIH